MPTGGTWKTQNKVRPGAYINFESVPKPLMNIGTRGVATMPVAMNWGPEGEVIEVFSEDLVNGRSTAKIGYSGFDEESQLFRELLKGCYKAYLYRIDKGGTKAKATSDNLTVTAKCSGIRGNDITITIEAEEDTSGVTGVYQVTTYLSGTKKDSQKATDLTELLENDWVVFEGSGTPKPIAAVPLTGGANGTVSADNFAGYFSAVDSYSWNAMGIPFDLHLVKTNASQYATNRSDEYGRKCQCVLYNYHTADSERVISCDQGYRVTSTSPTGSKVVEEEVSPISFVVWVTGQTAGADIDESLTNKVVLGATEIIGNLTHEEIKNALLSGKFVLSMREDGKIVVEQDINTYTTRIPDKGSERSKNRVVRVLDEFATTAQRIWNTSYCGYVPNDDNGRAVYKGDLINYGKRLQGYGAIQNFKGAEDIKVEQGDDLDTVLAEFNLMPVDGMEKLYMTVYVRTTLNTTEEG